MKIILQLYILSFLLFCFTSCINDQVAPPPPRTGCNDKTVTYNSKIKPIIDNSCAFSGCHDGSAAIPGDFRNYLKMIPFLTPELFEEKVIVFQDDPELGMPPDWDFNPGSKNLTDDEMTLIECWVSNGYPE